MAAKQGKETERDMISLIDFHTAFTVAKKAGRGEDAFKYSYNRDEAFFGVFDGCGGAGSQLCPKYEGKTEAYIASRNTADAFQTWFEQTEAGAARTAETAKQQIVADLRRCDELVGQKSMLIGGIRKKFPTTAAVGICRVIGDKLAVDYYWAGDSRVYLLNDQGLAQLSEDDLGGIDAMDNLTDDGILQNLISLSRDFTIHSGRIFLDRPGFVFAATDGCFGYLSTPMEFEYVLLEAILAADCISTGSNTEGSSRNDRRIGFEERLRERMADAGDDVSFCGYAIGFGSLQRMKTMLRPRANELYQSVISRLGGMSREEKKALWMSYRDNYHRLIHRVQ